MIRQLLLRALLAAVAVVALTGAASAAPPRGGAHGSFAPRGSYHAPVYHSAPYAAYPGYHTYPAYRANPVYRNGYRPFYGFAPYTYGYTPYPYSWSYPSVGGYLTTDPGLDSVPADDPPPATDSDPGDTQNPPPAAAPVSTGADAARPAHFTVTLPADAVLWFDTARMTLTGAVREFDTPPVAPGQQYTYTVHARWTADNLPTDQAQQITFTAGDRVAVTFPMPKSNP